MNDVANNARVQRIDTVARDPIVGRSIPRPALERFTSGHGVYVADIQLPGMLHVALARSSIAHGEILNIDTAEALRCQGVLAVLTATDLSDVKSQPVLWNLPGQQYTKLGPLAGDRVRYVGQPFAAVIARSLVQARSAADKIAIEFKPLPAVLSLDESMSDGALRIYPDWVDNVVGRASWRVGEPEEALAASAAVVTESFISQRVHALSLETRGVVARKENDGGLTVWTSTQSIHQVRSSIAECLSLPEHRIRVIAPDVGGAFGMKGCATGEETLVALIATRFDRPVRWIESRAEAFVGSPHGRDHRVEMQAGFDSDGRITALKARVLLDKGADATASSFGTAWCGAALLTGGYRVPAIDIEALGVMTNKAPTGPYRGYGQPESNLAIERTMDIAAARLGLTPVEIRRRNLVSAREMPFMTATGLALDSGEYERLMDLTLAKFGYAEAMERAGNTRNDLAATGVGFAFYTELTNFGPSAACKMVGISNGGFDVCTIRMEPSGHVRLFSSQTPMGQGVETASAQICADELGLAFSDINVIHGDTMTASYTAYASGGSRGAGVGGATVVLAARELASQVRRWGAHLLQVEADAIVLARGGVEVLGAPDKRLSMAEIAAAAYFGAFCPPGMTPGLEARVAYDPPAFAVSYGVVAVEIELDRETGKVRVTRVTFGHDCGTQINPALVDGQVRGGTVQAIGAALFEELAYDDEGRPLVNSMHDYLIPLATDVPAIDLLHLSTPSPFSPHGAKGVGESGTIAVPTAIMNAVQNAIGSGTLLTRLPLRAENVRCAIETAQSRKVTS